MNIAILDNILNFYKFAVTLAIFIFASYFDLKFREVSDLLWILLTVLTLPVTIFQVIFINTINLFSFLFIILINSIIAGVIYYLAHFGPADSIAIIVLSLALPFPPNFGFGTLLIKPRDYPLAVVLNGIILSVFYVMVNLIKNIRMFLKEGKLFDENYTLKDKIALLFLSEKIKKDKMEREKFYISLIVNRNGNKKLELFRNVNEMNFEDIESRKGYYESDYYWAENVQPFLVYLTISLVFTIIVGDLTTSFVLSLIQL